MKTFPLNIGEFNNREVVIMNSEYNIQGNWMYQVKIGSFQLVNVKHIPVLERITVDSKMTDELHKTAEYVLKNTISLIK